jgi:hypothetical protein
MKLVGVLGFGGSLCLLSGSAHAQTRPASGGGLTATHTTSSIELPYVSAGSGGLGGLGANSSSTLWDVTLDPQLLIVAVPHVAFSIGVVADIGAAGSITWHGPDDESHGKRESAYGMSVGLSAIF